MKSEKIQAYITIETKKAIVKKAKKEERSVSFIAGKLLDKVIMENESKKGLTGE